MYSFFPQTANPLTYFTFQAQVQIRLKLNQEKLLKGFHNQIYYPIISFLGNGKSE